MASLTWKVVTATRPGLVRDVPPGHESLMWVANSATIIEGERDAVLVDTLLTIEHNAMLVEQIAATGKELAAVYITHGHADHFFGLGAIRERFPRAQLLAMPQVVTAMQHQVGDTARWRALFPGQLADETPIAEPLHDARFELEGSGLDVIDLGHTDTAPSTALHVPSVGLVVAGDAVYAGIHPFLGESSFQSLRSWLSALDTIEALQPRAVVAGHKVPDADDSPRHIDDTRTYLRDFIKLASSTGSPRELFDAMMARHGELANVGSLWGAAQLWKKRAAA